MPPVTHVLRISAFSGLTGSFPKQNVANKLVLQLAAVCWIVLFWSSGLAKADIEMKEHQQRFCELHEGATKMNPSWKVRDWHFDNCAFHLAGNITEPLPDATYRENATARQWEQQRAYEGWEEANRDFVDALLESYEFCMLTVAYQIMVYVRKVKLRDVITRRLTLSEHMFLFLTMVRAVWTALGRRLTNDQSYATQLFYWLSTDLLLKLCWVWIIRQAVNGKDEYVNSRTAREVSVAQMGSSLGL